MITGNPALRSLALLKLRGSVRRQLRKVKSVSGCLYAVVGAVLGFGWVLSLVVGRQAFRGEEPNPETLQVWAQFGLGIFFLLSAISAASVRGVYLPKQDIERLFSSPVSRADLVRYRMIIDMGRTLFGAIVLALLTFHRMPNPIFGFFGAVTAVLTLGIVRQAFSLILGSAESRIGAFLRFRSLTGVRVILGIAVWVLIMAVLLGGRFTDKLFGGMDAFARGEEWLTSSVGQTLLWPFQPWARAMCATSLGEFSLWAGVCVSLGLILFEVTARLPIDYREHSLETSEAISKRISQVRKGGLFTGGRASQRTAGWRLPNVFGRGPMAAIAWVKFISIVRKARGTLLIGVLIVTLVTVGVSFLLRDASDEDAPLEIVMASSGLICLLGITYLGGALRFDFRSDLDRMVQIKSWPIPNKRIFIGTLLPQVLLISVLLTIAILVRVVALGMFRVEVLLIPLALPFLAFAWLAVDNAVYLFAPVRFVPGQEGSLHHTGRAIVLLTLRVALIAVALGVVGGMAAVVFTIGPEVFDLSVEVAAWISAGFGFFVLLALNSFLAWVGGRMLGRFDVARDSG